MRKEIKTLGKSEGKEKKQRVLGGGGIENRLNQQ